jgi:hypothetical protein
LSKKTIKEGKQPEIKRIANHTFKELGIEEGGRVFWTVKLTKRSQLKVFKSLGSPMKKAVK